MFGRTVDSKLGVGRVYEVDSLDRLRYAEGLPDTVRDQWVKALTDVAVAVGVVRRATMNYYARTESEPGSEPYIPERFDNPPLRVEKWSEFIREPDAITSEKVFEDGSNIEIQFQPNLWDIGRLREVWEFGMDGGGIRFGFSSRNPKPNDPYVRYYRNTWATLPSPPFRVFMATAKYGNDVWLIMIGDREWDYKRGVDGEWDDESWPSTSARSSGGWLNLDESIAEPEPVTDTLESSAASFLSADDGAGVWGGDGSLSEGYRTPPEETIESIDADIREQQEKLRIWTSQPDAEGALRHDIVEIKARLKYLESARLSLE